MCFDFRTIHSGCIRKGSCMCGAGGVWERLDGMGGVWEGGL